MTLVSDIEPKVFPPRITILDQIEFPGTRMALDLLLLTPRGLPAIMGLEIDELVDRVRLRVTAQKHVRCSHSRRTRSLVRPVYSAPRGRLAMM